MNTEMTNQASTPKTSPGQASPWPVFAKWFSDAKENESRLPEAFSIATVDESGMPNTRMVLMKGFGEEGITFYTNLESQKAIELGVNAKAAMCFHWKSLSKQIRIQGEVELVSDEEADAYFASRPKDSQIGAWASAQSRPLEGRFELEAAVAKYAAKYAVKKVDRPPFWSGYRLKPLRFEFWQEKPFRLHERQIYKRDDITQQEWVTERLYP